MAHYRAGGRNNAALVAMAVLLAASMLMAGADAGRWNHKHRHFHGHHGDHSPPAPPGAGFDQPMAAPSPPYVGDGPAAAPFTQSWSYGGLEGPVEGPVAAAGPSLGPHSRRPCDREPEAAPRRESGFY